jgi:hypothetical protein
MSPQHQRIIQQHANEKKQKNKDYQGFEADLSDSKSVP